MKHLTILVPEGENNLSSIVGAYKIFTRANTVVDPVFKIDLAGISKEVEFYCGLFTARPHHYITEIKHSDLIIIPSLNHNYVEAVKENGELIEWLGKQYRNGAEIASICTGAYLLAAAGLLDGKNCSTHWSAANELKQRYPKVNLKTDHIITDENGIYTNGGAYSFLNLILYLVEKYYGRQTAIFCAKVFQIEMDRHCQSSFMIFQGQRTHSDDLVKRAQASIEENVGENISIKDLVDNFAIGRRNFDRRFVKATGNTPVEYAQRVKVEAAKKALETSRKTINEVMYEVGYADLKAFREVFRRITGMSPLDYRNRYNKNAV